jgi:hypothetical protein
MITAGMAWVRNSKKMYEAGDGHVHVLEASVRNLNHLLGAFALQAEPATAPWEEWLAASFPIVIKGFCVQGGWTSPYLQIMPRFGGCRWNLVWNQTLKPALGDLRAATGAFFDLRTAE